MKENTTNKAGKCFKSIKEDLMESEIRRWLEVAKTDAEYLGFGTCNRRYWLCNKIGITVPYLDKYLKLFNIKMV